METQILSGIAAVAISELSNETNKPNRRSKWAGTFANWRYYKVWYDSTPWENHAFSYQLHIYNNRGDKGLGVMFFFWISTAKNKSLTDEQIAKLAEKMRVYAESEGCYFGSGGEYYLIEKSFNPAEESEKTAATNCLKNLIETFTPFVEKLNESVV